MKTLDELRREIDEIDESLKTLFEKRMECSKSVSEFKFQNHLPIYHKGREDAIICDFIEHFENEKKPYARAFLKNLIRQSREYQYYLTRDNLSIPLEQTPLFKVHTVCYPGIEGSHSGIATRELYPNAHAIPCDNFDAVFKYLDDGTCDIGVLPIDNSTAGTVGDVYDLLIQHDCYIVSSCTRHIHHYLLGIPGTNISQIVTAYSHPQALAQCAEYLKSHHIHAHEMSNTAVAARYVADLHDPSIAAVASKETATLYRLDIIDHDISDQACNQTRFISIAKKLHIAHDANRLSLAFNLPNESGALSDIIAIFADNNINLTKIMSRPIPNRPWEYTFYIDSECKLQDPYLKGALFHLKSEVLSLKLLGIFKEGCDDI